MICSCPPAGSSGRQANLDDGNMWATAFVPTKLTTADERRIAELVKLAVS
jgi:hypothetical protein